MRSYLKILSAAILLTAGTAYSSKVSSIKLDYINGFTVANIDVDGRVRFTHQTEIAKDGRPFRIIVDILSATHNLSAKTFEDLPDSRVTGIRTSQFSVKPEKIVRIVFDMKSESTYRIESQKNSVFLFIHDKESKPFVAWSTDLKRKSSSGKVPSTLTAKPTVAKEKPMTSTSDKIASINKALDDDRISSLEVPESKPMIHPKSGRTSVEKIKSKKIVPDTKKPVTTKKMYSPVLDDAPLVNKAQRFSSKPKAKPATQKTTVVDKQPMTKKALKKSSAGSEPKVGSVSAVKKEEIKTGKVSNKLAVPAVKTATSKPSQTRQMKAKDSGKQKSKFKLKKTGLPASPNKVKAGKLAKSGSSKSTKKASQPRTLAKATPKKAVTTAVIKKKSISSSKLTKNTNAVKPSAKKKKSSKASTVAKAKKKKNSTARFRRSPVQSRKIKGTMVAEFPKRLVIKYKGKRYRDPFETLINETKTSNSPVEKRVPNVEGLKLVGVIETAGDGNRALFEDNDGYGYILNAGDKVQKGYVLRVDLDKVYFQIFEYGWSRTVALNMDSY